MEEDTLVNNNVEMMPNCVGLAVHVMKLLILTQITLEDISLNVKKMKSQMDLELIVDLVVNVQEVRPGIVKYILVGRVEIVEIALE